MSEKTPIIHRDYLRLVNSIVEEAAKAKFEVKFLDVLVYGSTGYPFLMLRSKSRQAKYTACLTAGYHGDEPWATDCLIRSLGELNTTLWNYYVWPVMNPWGWVNGSRLNGERKGSNWCVGERDTKELKLLIKTLPTKVDCFVDVHGDVDRTEAYAYERKVPDVKSLAELALDEVTSYFDIQKAKRVYSEPCKNGVVTSGKEGTTEEYFFEQKGATYSITLEIPGKIMGTGINRLAGGAKLIASTISNFELAKYGVAK